VAQIQEVKTKRVVAGAAARPRDHDFEALSALEMRDQWVICVQCDRYTAEGFAVPVDAPPYNPTTLTLGIFSTKIESVISTSVWFSLCYIQIFEIQGFTNHLKFKGLEQ
jgi:hypothetical protein